MDCRPDAGSINYCNSQTTLMAEQLVILGAGESGVGAAKLAQKKGWKVLVSEYGTIAEKYRAQLQELAIDFEEGGHTMEVVLNADLIVKSPGIAPKTAVMKAIEEAGKSWEDEIEFAARYHSGKTLGVTGSNGKSTTTLWLYDMLERSGVSVGLAGNIGRSWAAQLAEGDKDYWVLELSSFQIDGLRKFRPDVAILCNITPDHLDRYNYQIADYALSKLNLFKGQSSDQYKILNADDLLTQEYYKEDASGSQTLWISLQNVVEGAYVKDSNIIFSKPAQSTPMSIHDLALHGKHNIQNAMAASVAANLLNIRKEAVRESLQQFQGVAHRLEFVATIHGIDFINDSKATNVNATWWALESAEKPLVWIVGGVDKGNDYTSLIPLVGEKVKAIICLGKDNKKILDAFSGIIPTIIETASAKQAVDAAYQLGSKGDAVLLSPACASFDLFENYEDRGNQFKQAVRAL